MEREPSCVRDVLEFLQEIAEEADDHLHGRDSILPMDWESRRDRAEDLRERLAYVWGE
jgi:hypothetical protein